MDKNVQYILEVAKCGGITKAANNLYITPSALSKFVQAREEELNVQLFHRIGKRFMLTAAGEYYVGRCKEIETIQKEITIQMERFSSMSHGMIRIGVQPSFSDLVLKDIIPKFQESFPAVKIILQEYSTGELMELLKKQQVDVVLATIDQKDADLEYRPVKMCEFVMAVGKNHHLATLAVAKEGFQYPWVDLKACEKEENVMLLPGSPFRQHADEIYGHYHLKPNIVYQISGTRTGLSCVAYHKAIMITLDHMIFNNPFSKEIVPLSIGDAPIQTEIDLIYMKDIILKTEMEKLYEIICEAIR